MFKQKVFIALLTMLSALAVGSCSKESQQVNPKPVSTTSQDRKVIHYAEWDEWGHASANCGGWGLCNYWDCWFCEVADKSSGRHNGTIEYDDKTLEGTLTIALNPSQTDEQEAIDGKSIFYIDKDISSAHTILRAGKYEFNTKIGNYGGYQIPLTVTKP